MKITIGMGSCGIAAGADEVYEALKSKGYSPTIVGCNGMCYLEPIITLNNEVYTGVTADGIDEIIAGNGSAYIPENTIEKRIALRNCGMLNPENIDEVIKHYADDDDDEENPLGDAIFRDILGMTIEEALEE